MKLKMSDKSLFAILLRSPWWISLLIVLVFALAARALLPAEYAAIGVLGTFPFMVIAAMAAWRQWRAPNPARLDAALQDMGAMTWRDFAGHVERTLQRQGYAVSRLEGEAADFRLERAGHASLLSCRRWKAAGHGVEPLRALAAACQAQAVRDGLYFSLVPVSEAARAYAASAGIRLLHGREFAALMVQVEKPPRRE